MSMKFTPVGATKGQLQVGSGLPVEIDTAGNLKAAGKVQGQPATAVGDVVTFEQAFGVGQNWVNELPNRLPNVSYTNTTPASISVYISFSVTANGGCIVIWSGSAILAIFERSATGTTGGGWVVIPPGQPYRVEPQGSTILTWWEYR